MCSKRISMKIYQVIEMIRVKTEEKAKSVLKSFDAENTKKIPSLMLNLGTPRYDFQPTCVYVHTFLLIDCLWRRRDRRLNARLQRRQ